MVDLQKGSALPRGLSLSDKIYLARAADGDSNFLTVAIRRENDALYLQDHTKEDIKDWASQESEQGQTINRQLDYISALPSPAQLVPQIMGIVNVTPDSFSDGGQFFDTTRAIAHGQQLVSEGAYILDIGGESTRPGAEFVYADDEIARVVPVIAGCADFGTNISIDTRKADVMQAAIAAGAGLINDVTALEYDRDSLQVAANSQKPVCLMHSFADPKVMQDNPHYDHALFDVIDYLARRVELCLQAGIDRQNIIVDPGIGFGKTLPHNLLLLKGLRFFHSLGCQVLLGVSRKSFITKIDSEDDAESRLGGSLAPVIYGLKAGVQVYRVHDVAQTRQLINVWQAIDNTSLTV
jgi:dihydropteroate synthase